MARPCSTTDFFRQLPMPLRSKTEHRFGYGAYIRLTPANDQSGYVLIYSTA
jgi:hypothetical protein